MTVISPDPRQLGNRLTQGMRGARGAVRAHAQFTHAGCSACTAASFRWRADTCARAARTLRGIRIVARDLDPDHGRAAVRHVLCPGHAMTRSACFTALALASSLASSAGAEEPAVTNDAPMESAPAAASPAPTAVAAPASPYALPFQLRPITQPTLVRVESASAWHGKDSTGFDDFNDVAILTTGYAFTKTTGVGLRLPFVYNAPSGDGAPGRIFQLANPAIAVTHTPFPAETVRFAFMAAASVPVGQGGSADASAASKYANTTGMLTRLSMDNMLFLPNDMAVATGLSCAYVHAGLTVQADVTMLNTFKVREVAGDATRTNGLAALGAGYFFLPSLSANAELLYQHWITTPAAVAADPSKRHNLSALVGVRHHHKFDWGWARPGLAIAQGVDGPIQHTTEVRLDVPFVF